MSVESTEVFEETTVESVEMPDSETDIESDVVVVETMCTCSDVSVGVNSLNTGVASICVCLGVLVGVLAWHILGMRIRT